MNEYQSIINIVLAALFGAVGWFCRVLWDSVAALKEDLSLLKVKLAEDYVPKHDFKELATEIRQMFQVISDKLDRKADK